MVNGGNGAEQFITTANGTRVRFERVTPAPFSLDIGTVESLVVNGNGGDDTFDSVGNLAALITTTENGGDGNDTIRGSNGADLLIGGGGNDLVDGKQGNDVAFLGTEDDVFQWDPGDGSDIVEGQAGQDTLAFNGSNVGEDIDISANGSRTRLFRNVGNVTMDSNGVERLALRVIGGPDNVAVNDLSGTDLTDVTTDLTATGGGDDGSADNVTVNGTNGNDVAVVTGQATDAEVAGLAATLTVTGAAAANDRLTVNALGGDDVIDASGVQAGSASLILDGGEGADVLIGGDGNDTLVGEAGDDVLLGGPGFDVLDGGTGDNVLIQGEELVQGVAAGQDWLAKHVRSVDGKTVLDRDGKSYAVPAADLI